MFHVEHRAAFYAIPKRDTIFMKFGCPNDRSSTGYMETFRRKRGRSADRAPPKTASDLRFVVTSRDDRTNDLGRSSDIQSRLRPNIPQWRSTEFVNRSTQTVLFAWVWRSLDRSSRGTWHTDSSGCRCLTRASVRWIAGPCGARGALHRRG
jgi:hypothetical protein